VICVAERLPVLPRITLERKRVGYATVNAVMAEADAELGLHGSIPAGSLYRSYQEALKNALDKANNNSIFVQPGPCGFSFPEPT